MRKAQLLATLITTVRDARDVITKRHDLADADNRATRAEITRLRDEVGELADATRAVLERVRHPAPVIQVGTAANTGTAAPPAVAVVTTTPLTPGPAPAALKDAPDDTGPSPAAAPLAAAKPKNGNAAKG